MGVFSNLKTLFKDKRHGKDANSEDHSTRFNTGRFENASHRSGQSTQGRNLKGQTPGRPTRNFYVEGVQVDRSGPPGTGLVYSAAAPEPFAAGLSRDTETVPHHRSSDRLPGRIGDYPLRRAMAGFRPGGASNSSASHGIQARNSLGSTDEDVTTRETGSPVFGGSLRRGRAPRISFDSSGHDEARQAQAEMERSWIAPPDRHRSQPSGVSNRSSIGHGTDHADNTTFEVDSENRSSAMIGSSHASLPRLGVSEANRSPPVTETTRVSLRPDVSNPAVRQSEDVTNPVRNAAPTHWTRHVGCEENSEQVMYDRYVQNIRHCAQSVIVQKVPAELHHESVLPKINLRQTKTSSANDTSILEKQIRTKDAAAERHVAKGHVVLNENAKAHEHILHQIHDAVRPALDEASIVEQDSTPAVPLVPQVLRQLSEAIAQRQFFAPVVTNHLEDKLGSGPMIKGLPNGTLDGIGRHCKTCTCNVEDKVDDRSTDYLEDEPDLSSGTHRTLPPSKRPSP